VIINGVDTAEFGTKVERLCDYLLDKVPQKNGSSDVKAIQDIKEDAANLQTAEDEVSFAGLSDYLKGVPQ
jgi:hypothetical protein